MNIYKNGFTLLITLFLISLFSLLSVFIVEISNISSNIDAKNLLYTQANLHLKSTINLISTIDIFDESKECINTMNIEDEFFDIKLCFVYITKRADCTNIISSSFDENTTKGMATVDIYITPKETIHDIQIHQRVIKKLE